MSGSRYTVPAVAGVTLLGGGIYMMRGRPSATDDPAQQTSRSTPRPDADEVERKKQQAQSKRDNAISGAGVGMTANTGGAELSGGSNAGNKLGPQHGAQQPGKGVRREDLPSGGVGGGHGAGNSNARSIEVGGSGSGSGSGDAGGRSFFSGWFGSGGGSSSGQNSSSEGAGMGTTLSQKLQGAAGTGGKTAGGQQYDVDPKDTRIKSHHADTPTNRGGSPFDKHRRDVTAVSDTSSNPGKE
ncbi:hypothetical protein ACHAQA_004286 [Verticillium albo-atrum]